MLALLQRRRGHSDVVPHGLLGAVAHQEAGFGAQDEGGLQRRRLLTALYPPISEGSGLADRPGELLQLLPKATTTGNSQESRQEGHPAGYGPQSPAGNPGGRGQEELVGPEGGLRFPRRTLLTKLHM